MSGLGPTWRSIQGNALFLYSRLLTRTARFRIEGWENVRQARETGQPLLWSFWHGQLMAFLSFGARHLDAADFVAIMVGDDRGDTLGAFAQRLGGSTFRVDMAGNPFAAGRAVLRVIQALRSGKQSVIAPDGPDGPAFVPKPGVAFLAIKAEATIVPVGAWTRQAIGLRRWDRYLLPFPFARYHTVIGEPLQATRRSDRDQLLSQITDSLHAVRTRAQILAGIRPWR